MTANDGGIEVLEQPHAAVLVAGIRRELEKVDRVRGLQRAREVGQEDDARLQRRDEQRLAPGVGAGQLGAELGDSASDLVPREVDLPDRVALGGEERG
jgi:hypothetical protein